MKNILWIGGIYVASLLAQLFTALLFLFLPWSPLVEAIILSCLLLVGQGRVFFGEGRLEQADRTERFLGIVYWVKRVISAIFAAGGVPFGHCRACWSLFCSRFGAWALCASVGFDLRGGRAASLAGHKTGRGRARCAGGAGGEWIGEGAVLSVLHIENIAVIEQADIVFNQALTFSPDEPVQVNP